MDLPQPATILAPGQPAAAPGPDRRATGGTHTSVSLDEQRARPREWRIPCQDAASRTRFLTVFVDHDRVVLVGPPGETATFSAGELTELSMALRQAAEQAERQR